MEKTTCSMAAALVMLIIASAWCGPDTATIDRAQEMFSMRHRNPGFIDSAIILLTDCVRTDPGNIRARVLLSEVYLKKGDRETDNKKKISCFTKGEEQASLAIARDSANGRARLWQVSNLSLICKTKGIMSSLANIPKIKQGIARALQLDPSYPKAYAAQGMIYMELPAFLGGNLDSARCYFEKGLVLDPSYAGIYVKMAVMYAEKKEYGEARRLINFVLTMKNPSDKAEYELVNRPEALKLMEKIRGK